MATNTSLTTQPEQQSSIAVYLGKDAVKQSIANVIGEKNTTWFISSVVSAVQANPKLAECSNASILSAALQGEALQLAPSPQLGQFYIVPYRNRKKVGNQWVDVDEAQYQLGYKGYLQLAIRSGQYRNIVVSEIKEGEADYNPITEEIDLHPIMDPAKREEAKTVGYYAMFELMNGFKKQLYSPIERIKAHAHQYSRGYRFDLENNKRTSPWSTNFDAMAKKTLIRQLIGKWGIMSVEMQRAYSNDMGVIDEDGSVRYVDNPQAVNIEVEVHDDIAANANSVSFEDAEVVVEPAPAQKPSPMPEPTPEAVKAAEAMPEAPKKGRKKAEPKQEPAPAPKQETPKSAIDIPDGASDPGWWE